MNQKLGLCRKMLKSSVCMLLVAGMILSMATVVFAKETDSASGKYGENIAWSFANGTLTLGGTGAVNMAAQGYPWAEYKHIVESIIIDEGITELGRCSFLEYYNLKSVSLPDSLTYIGSQAFQSCNSLEEIRIPRNVSRIGDRYGSAASAFSGDSLHSIIVDEENARYYSVDGVLFDRENRAVLCYPMGKIDESYTVPEGIALIGYGAFWHCKAETVTLPTGLLSIEEGAFYAADISGMELPDTLQTIEERAFANCDDLSRITIPHSVSFVAKEAFASCEAMEYIVINNPDCSITADGETISSNSTVVGYQNSTAHAYAIQYGRNFVDVLTGVEYNFDKGNEAFLSMLPSRVSGTAPVWCSVSMMNKDGELVGYQPQIVVETDTSNAVYQEMLAFVQELTKDCSTDYEKACIVSQWVTDNMTYVFGMSGGGSVESIYSIWEHRVGNCMSYTSITNFLLYLLDIPTAKITSYGHCWSAALVDGKWIMIDSTNGIFDGPADAYDKINEIFFAVDNILVCVINDLTGVKLASYGISVRDHQSVDEITIPEYIVFIYKSVFFLENSNGAATTHLTIKGTAGSYAESYLHSKLTHYNRYVYEDGMFSATVEYGPAEEDPCAQGHLTTVDAQKDATCTEDGWTEGYHCARCGLVMQEQKAIPATGHCWGQWGKIINNETGRTELIRCCSDCGSDERKPDCSNPFGDVTERNRFKDAIMWAYHEGIAFGKTEATFAPDEKVTRAQFVTFLWRMAGEPEPASWDNPFADVGENNRFFTAILWAFHGGITVGKTANTFCPDDYCTRAQVVAFLYRYAGLPEVGDTECTFEDVTPSNRFLKAIVWAEENEITSGKTRTSFAPEDNCTRAQVVAFLYRYTGKTESASKTSDMHKSDQ